MADHLCPVGQDLVALDTPGGAVLGLGALVVTQLEAPGHHLLTLETLHGLKLCVGVPRVGVLLHLVTDQPVQVGKPLGAILTREHLWSRLMFMIS